MVDQPGNPVPMCEWEAVYEVKGAKKLLAFLNKDSHCHLATVPPATGSNGGALPHGAAPWVYEKYSRYLPGGWH